LNLATFAERYGPAPPRHAHVHGLSRRRFLHVAAGATATGAALGVSLIRSGSAAAAGAGDPRPIPGGLTFGTDTFHVLAPNPGDPTGEPATITDFNGVVGLAYISGMVTRTNTKTNEVRHLPFVDSDMRFMSGVFRGTDGQVHQGTFGLI
jgi:hypothetical protein